MNRREALQLLAAGTALQLAPRHLLAALREARAVLGAQAATRTLNSHQDATVKAIAEMIIPRTETPGAADVGASDFIDLMLTEWYDEPDRTRFLNGLAEVDARTQSLFGKDFVSCSADQQSEMLTELGEKMVDEAERRKTEPAHDVDVPEAESFYPMLRRLTLTAYYTSEAGATEELHFQIIPDRHDMCAAEDTNKGGA
jgi:hypothetical protein